LKAYHAARAAGGVGLDIVENAAVDTHMEGPNKGSGARLPFGLNIDEERHLPGLRDLAQLIKDNGARAALQLYHGTLWALPPQKSVFGSELPRELPEDAIQAFTVRFADAAKRAKEAGFDAIEIHGSNINLQTQFRNRVWNKRTDKYGGSVENRGRFMCDTIKAIKNAVGKDFPVWCRISLFEVFYTGGGKVAEYGITLEDTIEHARMFVEAGVDAIHVSAFGFYDYTIVYYPISPPSFMKAATYLDMIDKVKKAVNVPLIGVGRLSPEAGDLAIKEGKLDFVAIGRAIQVDPELPNKIASGRRKDVIPCIACNHCFETLSWADGVVCVVNPAIGREQEFEIKKAAKPKKVVVAGGGPAGMSAARIAAMRGHAVTLYEKEKKLGGQLEAAAVPPHRGVLRSLTSYLTEQLNENKVAVELGKALTPDEVEKLKPDVVIIATGSSPITPEDIPGLNEHPSVVTAVDVLLGKADVGDRVVIIGGERVGCETAEFLADKGKQVTVTKRGQHMADKMNPDMRLTLVDRLKGKGVRLLTNVQYMGVTETGLNIHVRGGVTSMAEIAADGLKNLTADTIVLAAGAAPNTDLLPALEGKVAEIHCVGDCVEPRRILEAIREGWRVASEI
ncbi:MAG: FAD-dependent oxidoreductase, partial [Dehalococcoidia bacterium]